MTSSIAVQLTANGEKLVQSTGGYLRTISQQARAAARDIAGDTAGAIEAGFKDGMRGVEREYRANIKSLEDLTRSASLTNGAVKFDRSAHNAELQAARERLEVQQRLAVALDRVAAEQSENAVAARIQAAAAAASIQRAEEEVRALERKAAVLDRLQAELGETAVAQRRFNNLTGEARQGAQQFAYNVADIASGVASGIPPMQIFAQQGTQVVQSLQLMTTKTDGLLGLLGGPWGLIITSAITVLGSFAYSLLSGEDAADKATKANESFVDQLDREKHSLTEVQKALDDYYRAKERGREIDLANAQVAAERVKQHLDEALAIRKKIAAMLDEMGTRAMMSGGAGGDFAIPGQTAMASASLRALLDRNTDELNRLSLQAQSAVTDVAEQLAKLDTDDTTRIKTRFDVLRNEARSSISDVAKLRAELARLNREEQAALDKVRESKRSSGSGAASRDARVGDMVALIKQLFPGAQVTSTTGGKHTKRSDHYAGRAIDFVVPGMMNAAGTEEVYRRLKEAGVDIRRNARGTEQFFGPGRAASKPGDHNNHFHAAWQGAPDPERVADAQKRAAEQAARAAEQLARNVDNASERAAALRSQFDPLPADLDRASNALIDIQQEIAKNQALLNEKGLGAEQAEALKVAIADLELTRDKLIPESLTKGLRDDLAAMQEAIEGQQMLIDGRRAEYDRLQDNVELARLLGAESTAQLGTMIRQRGITDAQLQAYYDQRDALRAQTIELQRQQDEQQKLLQVVDDVAATAKGAIYDLFDGRGLGAVSNALKSLMQTQKNILTEEIFTAVFGQSFENQKLKILGLDKVDETGRAMATAIDRTIDPILALGEAAQTAADQLNGTAANDNGLATLKTLSKTAGGNAIEVNARRTMQQELRSALDGLGKKIGVDLGSTLDKTLRGAAYGEAANGILRSLGVKSSKTGGQIGGAIGTLTGIPGADIAGAFLGSFIGGLFKKTPRGYATIGAGGIASTGGNSSTAREAGIGAAGSTIDSLESIAKALGGTFDPSRGSVSIGRSGDSWHVDTSGRGRLKKSQGGFDFDDDYEAAVRFATMDLIKDGVITGISAAAQRVLQSGKDLQQAIEKASLIESIPKLLKARTSPVAAALDELNDKWDRTVAVLKEGGATAAQYAEAQKLYELERSDIMKAANDNLKSFIDGLNFGPSSGLSLRDQSANARAELQPYLDAIAKGDIAGIDRDKYLAAADSYMQITRALNGSGSGYFNTVDELRKATQSLLDQSVNQAKAAEARDPFAEQTAKSTQATANILDQHTRLLEQLVNGTLGRGAISSPGDVYIGAPRGYAVNPLR